MYFVVLICFNYSLILAFIVLYIILFLLLFEILIVLLNFMPFLFFSSFWEQEQG